VIKDKIRKVEVRGKKILERDLPLTSFASFLETGSKDWRTLFSRFLCETSPEPKTEDRGMAKNLNLFLIRAGLQIL